MYNYNCANATFKSRYVVAKSNTGYFYSEVSLSSGSGCSFMFVFGGNACITVFHRLEASLRTGTGDFVNSVQQSKTFCFKESCNKFYFKFIQLPFLKVTKFSVFSFWSL